MYLCAQSRDDVLWKLATHIHVKVLFKQKSWPLANFRPLHFWSTKTPLLRVAYSVVIVGHALPPSLTIRVCFTTLELERSFWKRGCKTSPRNLFFPLKSQSHTDTHSVVVFSSSLDILYCSKKIVLAIVSHSYTLCLCMCFQQNA